MIKFAHHYKQRNKELAIQGSVKLRLEEILPHLTKNRLSDIASSIDLPRRSKMNKDELTAELQRNLLKEHTLDLILLLSHENEFLFFQEVLNQPYVQNNDIPPGTYLHFKEHGILFTFWDKERLYFVIPEEVKEALKQLDWEALLWTRSWGKLVLQYVTAAVNLYGVCTPELVLQIYNDQNEESLSMTDLEEITEFHLTRMQYYQWIDGYLVNQYFDQNEPGEIHDLLRRILNKPRYIPDRAEFLKHSEDQYFEMTPQLLQLRLYILNQLCNDAELVDEIIEDIQLACSMEEPLQVIVNELDRRNIVFDNYEQAQRFASLVTEVYNHTRLWSNCGHTPAELSALTKGSVNRLIPGQRIADVKIGRNDPCPCGSGKKFKKCCGK